MPLVSKRASRAVVLWSALLATAAGAQAPAGRITGTVRAADGGPLGAALVTARNASGGALRSVTTRDDGRYVIPGLATGGYTVTASLIGYRRAVRADVRVDGEATVDFSLETLPLQQVVVTATLREQTLEDVPFSIAAPTASVLRERGAENLEAVAANVAGFTVQNLGPGQNTVAVRGASAGQIARDQPGVKEQVGAYLDDVPISLSLFTPDLDLFDVSRVEVLRGPQGTLFGAGSLSGTVRYITNQPELGVRSTFGEVGANSVIGGGAGAVAKLGANVPLGERAAARVAGWFNRLPGFMDAVQPGLSVNENVNAGSRAGGRAALRLAPTDALTITPRVAFQAARADGWNRIDAFNILANPYTTTRPAVTLGARQQFTQIEEPFSDDFLVGDVNVRYDFGPAALTSVTSLTRRDVRVVRDAGALTSSITGGSIGLPERVYSLDAPLDDQTDSRVLTQELRLAGGGGRARWLAGGFFSDNRREYAQRLTVAGFESASGVATRGLRAPRDVLFYSDLAYDLRQTAVFGEATVSVLPRLDLTGGLRYYRFDEDREQVFDGIFGNDDNGKSLVSTPGSIKADGLAPRVIASFRATDDLTFNAQAARGFRLGGINDPLNVPLCTAQDLATFSGRDSWREETAWNYEVGAKARFLGGRGSLNVSAFNMDISDLQMTVTAGSCSSRLIFNVPEAVSRGAEVELTLAPTPAFDLSASATFTDAELRSTLTSTDAQGRQSVVAGIQSGNRLPSVPRLQGALAATLRRPLRGGSLGYLTGALQHLGSRYTQIEDLTPGLGTVNIRSFGNNTIGGPLTQGTFTFDPELPAYTLLNLRAGLRRASWEAALFVNNVTDERALLALDRERGLRARVGYLTNQPRTAGVTITFQR
jgi:iron complex outermembrane receptor protein